MRVEHDVKLTFDDVLIRPKRSTLVSRSDVTLVREFKFRHSGTTWTGVPIVAANMDSTGLFSIAAKLQQHQMITCMQKFYSTRDYANAWEDGIDPEFVAVTCGSTDDSFDLLKRKMATNSGIKLICIDVANGYREVFLDFVKRVREEFPSVIIIAGNVATREMTEALILAGADIVKVGIGPGSVCTTRKVAGVGYPQLSAISECADAAHGLAGHVMADGGCSSPGDVAKAFAAGADFVMLGGCLLDTTNPVETLCPKITASSTNHSMVCQVLRLWKHIMEKLPNIALQKEKRSEFLIGVRLKLPFRQFLEEFVPLVHT